MPDSSHLLLFIVAGWLLNLTPGPDVLYIVSRSLKGGWRAGLVAGAGVNAGCFVHIFAAALGVGALLAASATAFTILKWIGAAYLVWIGLKTLLARPAAGATDYQAAAKALPTDTWKSLFLGGFWTNVLNPKVVLFFLAFLPQFISPDSSSKAEAFLALGLLFNLNSIPVNAGWALAAAWMARRPAVQRGMHWLDKAAGGLFIMFGIRLAMTQRPQG